MFYCMILCLCCLSRLLTLLFGWVVVLWFAHVCRFGVFAGDCGVVYCCVLFAYYSVLCGWCIRYWWGGHGGCGLGLLVRFF